MARRLAGFALVSAALLQAVGVAQPNAQQFGMTDDRGAVPQLVLSIEGLSPNGPFGGEARVTWNLDRDHVARLRVSAGSADQPNLCSLGSGGLRFEPGTLVGWSLDARLLEARPTGARVQVRWTRTVMQPGVIAEGNFEREHEVRLSEGHHSVIDLVRPLDQGASGCDGVVVQLGFEYADLPQLASELLDYDIWLVHHEADGRQVLDRSGSRALQGEQTRYLFRQLRYDEQGLPRADGPVSMEFGGWLRGRVRPDGRIDLSIGAHRTVRKNRHGNGEHGNKTATVGDGDTLEVELPPYTWQGTNQRQRTSVRVTARRVR